jgi:hypothetical protein
MHIVAGTFRSREEASSALRDLEKQGIAPVRMNVIQDDDTKGFEREHRPTRTALRWGAFAGAVFGIAVFGVLLWISGLNPATLRFIALYLSGIALCTAGGAAIFAFWNMGVSHDEALLYEEAKQTHAVIAAVEVDDPMQERVKNALKTYGARDVRCGDWQPSGWKHTHPTFHEAV